jgi:chemotaxis signal transduction protein
LRLAFYKSERPIRTELPVRFPRSKRRAIRADKQRVNAPTPTRSAEKHLVVRVAGENFALPIRRVRGIVAHIDIAAVPSAPPFVHGEIRSAGRTPVTVIDLRRRFGVGGRGEESCIVLVETGGESRPRRKYGLLVDSVAETAAFASGETVGSTGPTADYIRGVARAEDGRSVVLLDLNALLDPQSQSVADNKAA